MSLVSLFHPLAWLVCQGRLVVCGNQNNDYCATSGAANSGCRRLLGGFFDAFWDFLPGERRLKSRRQPELAAPQLTQTFGGLKTK